MACAGSYEQASRGACSYDLPSWHTVYEQSQHWFKVGMFEAMVHDLRKALRLA
jgi:hypothetical protein